MLAAQGASLLEIADVLGHKTLAMVKRYSHLVVDHKAKVIKRMVAAKGLRQARSAALLRIWIADSAQRPAGVCPFPLFTVVWFHGAYPKERSHSNGGSYLMRGW